MNLDNQAIAMLTARIKQQLRMNALFLRCHSTENYGKEKMNNG